jgi:hypothetical protein
MSRACEIVSLVSWFKFVVGSCGEKLSEMYRKPLLPTEFSKRPWKKVASDLFVSNKSFEVNIRETRDTRMLHV